MSRNNIILVIVLLVIIIFVVRYLKKKNSDATTEIKNPIQGVINQIQGTGVVSSPNSTTVANTPPVIKTTGFSFGDNLYAKENNVNTYKTASATSGNLASYKPYAKDSFIGTYLGKESVFVKVLIPSPASSVFVLSTQLYSK